MKEVFRGSAVAIATPFARNGIDWDAFAGLLDFQIREGTQAIIAAGTTGEPSTMTPAEKMEVIRFVIDRVDGRIPVIAGTGSNNTAQSIDDARAAAAMGADALLVVTPYYNKTTTRGLIAHYHAIADAVDIPVIAYNVPGRTGLNLTPVQMAAIADHPHIGGIKEASGDLQQVLEIRRLCPDLPIYSGTDQVNLPILACGGSGSISVTANVAPRLCREMHDAFFTGNLKTALEIQLRLAPLTNALFMETSPIPLKAALSMMGLCENRLRLPLVEMEEGHRAILAREMESLGIPLPHRN